MLVNMVCVLCCVSVSVCVNGEEYEVNYADNYENEITQDQQDGDSPVTTCQTAELSRWNKLFVALEDSHQREMMLMEALKQRFGGPGVCQQCLPAIEAICRGQAEQASPRLQRGLVELKEEVTEREGRMNASLQQIRQEGAESYRRMMDVLHQLHRPHRLEESKLSGEVTGGAGSIGAGHREAEPIRTGTAGVVPSLGVGLEATRPIEAGHTENGLGLGEGLSGTGGPIGTRPGSVGAGLGLGLGMKPFLSSTKKQEVTSSPSSDRGKIERALVAIAMELRKVQTQLGLISSVGNEG
ncbi:uncharacterized protein LOC123490914 [Coregonus clupeaformis]|uniref:uncharacterized protein LOC123490914 n=1 Tax=Coregonus clupeaformis TaxID=59861 RepID=UPI001E1C2FF7|nr:uncharacterized protein LOC123490914 [Coregonus clupeaformis]